MRKFLLLLMLLFIQFNAFSQKYIYADGSANTYRITNDSLIYTPVKPQMSSSGTYDGGKAYAMEITKEQYSEIKKLIGEAVKAKKEQQKDRTMGSGMITTYKGRKSKTIILKQNSAYRGKIESLLKNYGSR